MVTAMKGRARTRLAGPGALVGAAVVWFVADRGAGIGPFDRAQLTGFVALPLFLISPGVIAIALGPAVSRARVGMVAACSGLVAVTLTALLLTATGQVGCQPVHSIGDVLPGALLVGTTGGGGYGIAIALASVLWRRGARLGVVVAGAGVAVVGAITTLGVFFSAFPAYSCAVR